METCKFYFRTCKFYRCYRVIGRSAHELGGGLIHCPLGGARACLGEGGEIGGRHLWVCWV